MSTTTDVDLDELRAMLDTEPPICELNDPPKGERNGAFMWFTQGEPCEERAVERWRLVCPSHGPVPVWICQRHIDIITAGRYPMFCEGERVSWEPT